ncbi:MAG: hypothetical protein Kow0092_02340 [Deferrisomatales bacterium]
MVWIWDGGGSGGRARLGKGPARSSRGRWERAPDRGRRAAGNGSRRGLPRGATGWTLRIGGPESPGVFYGVGWNATPSRRPGR